MKPVDNKNISSEDLFGLDKSQKDEVIKSSSQLYIKQIEMVALLLETDFLSYLKKNIEHTEKEIQRLTEEEDYETCYFLKEIINQIKTEYNGL